MDSPELIILDVGHGNCSVLLDPEGTAIIDCADGNILLEFLERRNVREVSHVFVSHADSDHVEGIILLLADLEITVRNVYVNSDSRKNTKTWHDFRLAIADVRRRGTRVSNSLTIDSPGKVEVGNVCIEVLSPSPEQATAGVGGKTLYGNQTLTPNSLSAVLAIIHDSYRVALLAGDVDNVGLEDLLSQQTDLTASILVFPHHGGRPSGADAKAFAQKLCGLVSPKLILFSNERGRFATPRPEILEGLRLAVPNSYVLCTQLSKNCAGATEHLKFSHLSDLPASGEGQDKCCGGSVVITLRGKDTVGSNSLVTHTAFTEILPTPLCRQKLLATVEGASKDRQ